MAEPVAYMVGKFWAVEGAQCTLLWIAGRLDRGFVRRRNHGYMVFIAPFGLKAAHTAVVDNFSYINNLTQRVFF